MYSCTRYIQTSIEFDASAYLESPHVTMLHGLPLHVSGMNLPKLRSS